MHLTHSFANWASCTDYCMKGTVTVISCRMHHTIVPEFGSADVGKPVGESPRNQLHEFYLCTAMTASKLLLVLAG